MARKIIHLDMDAFYASVEQRDHPELHGKPVIVGADPGARGVVSAASYEARQFGVHSAMPSSQAKRLCPQGIFVAGRMSRYMEVSRQIMAILREYTPLVEQLSVDEAFLDVTGSRRLFGDAPTIARTLQQRIGQELSLPCSVGIAPNKFLAKLASDHEKPHGFVIINEGEELAFLRPLPISRLWGVGKSTELRLRSLGITTIGRLADYPRDLLVRQFGVSGGHMHDLARGIDDRPVTPESEAKSISGEHTYQQDTRDMDLMQRTLIGLTEEVGRRLRKSALKGRTVQLKLRFGDFTTITRRRTLSAATDSNDLIYQTILDLLSQVSFGTRKVRLLGVGVSNFAEPVQGSLFGEQEQAHSCLDDAVDVIRERFGASVIKRGRMMDDEDD